MYPKIHQLISLFYQTRYLEYNRTSKRWGGYLPK
uniref:Uncharacterized protein n=1 Tax=Anguilla anguilla TaxID=7936 RepID=A0A0E9QTX0_ANGAN